MKERPILFSGPMVRAILEGRKTQTRRVVANLARNNCMWLKKPTKTRAGIETHVIDAASRGLCPYGKPGDRLRVKEHAWMWCENVPNGVTKKGRAKFKYVPLRSAPVRYCADHPEKPTIDVVCEQRGHVWGWRKKLGRFLPSWASRITLEIAGVRVERLNAISEKDAIAEGIERREFGDGTRTMLYRVAENVWENDPVAAYRSLWESINGPGSWAANSYVWVIEFRRVAA